MKTTRTLLALGLAGAFTSPAWAQSSVTLFGIVDLAARSVSNEGSASMKSLVSGSNSTSRLGFRGVEDLGDGLSAGFHLEHGFQADIGAPVSSTQFFDRRATLSLASRTLGEIRGGRDYVPTYVLWTRTDPFSYVGAAGANNFISATPLGPIRSAFGANLNTTVRSSNAIEYLLPTDLFGIEGGVMVAAGEGGAVANGAAKVVSARLGYGAGPFLVAVATATTENSLTTAGKFKDRDIAASYNAGFARVSAAWRQFRYSTAKQTDVLVGVVVPVGVSEIKFSWHRANLEGTVGATNITANDADQIGLGYLYNLSKRTALYATVARIDNQGGATYTVPGGSAAPTAGGHSTGYEAGIRHYF